MNQIGRKEIIGGYAVAAASICGGAYLGTRAEGEALAAVLPRIFTVIACLIILKTFALGRLRGFPARREDSRLDLTNVLRNVAASVIVFFGSVFLAGPVVVYIVSSRR